MKQLIGSLILFFVLGTSFAQSSFGVKLNYSSDISSAGELSYIGANQDVPSYQLEFVNSKPSFSAGLYHQYRAGYLYSQSELLVRKSTLEFQSTSFNDDINANGLFEENSTFIDIPVMGGVYVKGFTLGVGPIFHFLVNHESQLEDLSYYNKSNRTLSSGFQAMIGFDLKNLHFDIRYENTFNTVGQHITYANNKASGFKTNPNVLTLGVAYTL